MADTLGGVRFSDEAPPAPPKGPPCSVGALVEGLTDDERALFDSWLADRTIQSAEISRRILRDLGVTIAGGTIGRHRRGDCLCGR